MKKNYDEQFEKWLKVIIEKIENDEACDSPKARNDLIRTRDFTKQVAAALRDEFIGKITVTEPNIIKVNFPSDNIFVLKIMKI